MVQKYLIRNVKKVTSSLLIITFAFITQTIIPLHTSLRLPMIRNFVSKPPIALCKNFQIARCASLTQRRSCPRFNQAHNLKVRNWIAASLGAVVFFNVSTQINMNNSRPFSLDTHKSPRENFYEKSKNASRFLITMPGKDELQKRLNTPGMDHFAENSGILEHFADRELNLIGIYLAVELALYNYSENLKQGGVSAQTILAMMWMLEDLKPEIYRALLKDESEAAFQALIEYAEAVKESVKESRQSEKNI